MNEEWWEGTACWICNYWWLLLICLIIGLIALFAWPYISNGLFPAPTVNPLPTIIPTLEATQTLGSGDVQVTLRWDNTHDLDLWVIDPNNEKIFYNHTYSQSGGQLDVDANAGCGSNIMSNPVENIYWPIGGTPIGSFTVKVHYYADCEIPIKTEYEVRVLVDGQVTEYEGTLEQVKEEDLIVTFTR